MRCGKNLRDAAAMSGLPADDQTPVSGGDVSSLEVGDRESVPGQVLVLQVVVNTLRLCPIFRGLNDSDLYMIARLCSERAFSPGETLAAAGMRRSEAYLIREGSVGLFLRADGEEVPLDHYSSGDLVSVMGLMDTRPVGAFTARAVSAVRCYVITAKSFQDLANTHPHIGFEVMSAAVGLLSNRLFQALHLLRSRQS